MQEERIADLELLLGHAFRDRDFLVNALSHSSIKTDSRPSNERLEFLGDSVLGLIISDALYRRFPEDDEGTLTRIKSQAVSRAALQRLAVAMGLDRYIMVGKGVAKREIPASLLGNLFEAIVGAIYLDAGLASARKFVLRHLDIVIEEILDDRAERNYKSMLQHHCQRELSTVPNYRVHREAGPAHSRKFEVSVMVGGREVGRARAESKKEAEQGAARAAMIHFQAVDEKPSDAVRGAGTLVKVGPAAGGKKRSRRGGRRRGKGGAGGDAPAVEKREGGDEEKAPSRRRRRGGRRRRGSGEGGESKAAPAPPKKKAAKKKAARKKTAKKAAKKVAKKRSTRKKKTSGGDA